MVLCTILHPRLYLKPEMMTGADLISEEVRVNPARLEQEAEVC